MLCDHCKGVIAGETTVGTLVSEGDALRKEGIRVDDIKLLTALSKYNEAWKALKSNDGHPECVESIDNDYRQLYRIVQGSRA